jgi:hypothetical protein
MLGSLLLLMAINAFGGGFYAMAGAKDVPVEWLKESPFPDYFIPGLFLFLVIGGSALLAAVASIQQAPPGTQGRLVLRCHRSSVDSHPGHNYRLCFVDAAGNCSSRHINTCVGPADYQGMIFKTLSPRMTLQNFNC